MPEHGTPTMYRYGCHCPRCRKAESERIEAWRVRIGYYKKHRPTGKRAQGWPKRIARTESSD